MLSVSLCTVCKMKIRMQQIDKQVATAMVAPGRIAIAAQIDQSYSSGGANVHQFKKWFLAPHESAPKQHLDRFIRFCKARWSAQQRDKHTAERATAVAIVRVYSSVRRAGDAG